MNLFQKIAALFGAQYIVQVWNDSISVHRVQKIGKRWYLAESGTMIAPQGAIHGRDAKWEPLTSKVERFYKVEVIG